MNFMHISYTLLFSTALPTILNLQVPGTLKEGEINIALVCSFTGIPPAMVHWEKDGKVFSTVGSRRVNNSVDGLSQLEIGVLGLTDEGDYACVVTNLAGTVTQSGKMKVEG